MADNANDVYEAVRRAFDQIDYEFSFKTAGEHVVAGPVEGYTLKARISSWTPEIETLLNASPARWGIDTCIPSTNDFRRMFRNPGKEKSSVTVTVRKPWRTPNIPTRTVTLRTWLAKEEPYPAAFYWDRLVMDPNTREWYDPNALTPEQLAGLWPADGSWELTLADQQAYHDKLWDIQQSVSGTAVASSSRTR